MPSETARAVTAAVQWTIVGIAIGVIPTYVLVAEHAKKEATEAASAAASSAAAAVYAAWSAEPKPSCPAPAITLPTVVAVTQSGQGGPQRPVRVAAPEQKDDDDAKMLIPMMGAMQQMLNGQGGQQPDINELMKNMPKK